MYYDPTYFSEGNAELKQEFRYPLSNLDGLYLLRVNRSVSDFEIYYPPRSPALSTSIVDGNFNVFEIEDNRYFFLTSPKTTKRIRCYSDQLYVGTGSNNDPVYTITFTDDEALYSNRVIIST